MPSMSMSPHSSRGRFIIRFTRALNSSREMVSATARLEDKEEEEEEGSDEGSDARLRLRLCACLVADVVSMRLAKLFGAFGDFCAQLMTVRMCVFRLLFCVKREPHFLHSNGLSPV